MEYTLSNKQIEEQLEKAAALVRTKEIVPAVVKSVGTQTVEIGGESLKKEIAYLELHNGLRAICPAEEFSEHEFASLNGFTGTIQSVVLTHIDLETGTTAASVKQADRIKKTDFKKVLSAAVEDNTLLDHEFVGVVAGFNPATNKIFVRVNGTDCYMYPSDWDWNRNRNIEDIIERGQEIKVKVVRCDLSQDLYQVSRRHTIKDPWSEIEQLKHMNTVAGKVTTVHHIHGIFIKLDNGLEVKGQKPNKMESPDVGDVVTCAVREVDKENRRAKVVIVGYPRGKRKKKDLGGFLFEQ
ncbi:30S ribosomal protein S1 [Bacillus sp. FJAT-26377]|uniref:30S ribosomal protein S1 n=1 Tax=Bacillus altitudinis TaxID=293387 RepID=UPI002570B72F